MISTSRVNESFVTGPVNILSGYSERSTHLLHLRQHVLVRGELAIEAEQLLLLLSEFLQIRSRIWVSDLLGMHPDIQDAQEPDPDKA